MSTIGERRPPVCVHEVQGMDRTGAVYVEVTAGPRQLVLTRLEAIEVLERLADIALGWQAVV